MGYNETKENQMKVQFVAYGSATAPEVTTVINGDTYRVRVGNQWTERKEGGSKIKDGAWMYQILINGQSTTGGTVAGKDRLNQHEQAPLIANGQVARTKKACIEVATKALSDLTQVDVIANSKPLVKIIKRVY